METTDPNFLQSLLTSGGLFLLLLNLFILVLLIITWIAFFVGVSRLWHILKNTESAAEHLKAMNEGANNSTLILREIRNHLKGLPDEYGFQTKDVAKAKKYRIEYFQKHPKKHQSVESQKYVSKGT